MQVGQGMQQLPQLGVKVWANRRGYAEKIGPLSGPDDDTDAGSEANNDGLGYKFDHPAKPRYAHEHQHQTRHQCGNLQTGHAMACSDTGKHHNERTGGAGDLQSAAAKERHSEAGNDRCVDTLLGLGTGGDSKGHGQRQRYDANSQAGNQIGQPVLPLEEFGTVSFEQGDQNGRRLA